MAQPTTTAGRHRKWGCFSWTRGRHLVRHSVAPLRSPCAHCRRPAGHRFSSCQVYICTGWPADIYVCFLRKVQRLWSLTGLKFSKEINPAPSPKPVQWVSMRITCIYECILVFFLHAAPFSFNQIAQHHATIQPEPEVIDFSQEFLAMFQTI